MGPHGLLLVRQAGQQAPLCKHQYLHVRNLGYKRVMTIQRVISSSASRQTFNCQEFGGHISIKDYFLKSAPLFCVYLSYDRV